MEIKFKNGSSITGIGDNNETVRSKIKYVQLVSLKKTSLLNRVLNYIKKIWRHNGY